MKRPTLTNLLLLLLATLTASGATAPGAVQALKHLRPVTNGPIDWGTGEYQYDGAGNIMAIGAENFVYDADGALHSATLRGPDLTSYATQEYTYDAYGNMQSMAGTAITVDTETNRLDQQLADYDAAGRMTQWQPVSTQPLQRYVYDGADMLKAIHLGTNNLPEAAYIYNAADERVVVAFLGTTPETNALEFNLRGPDGKVLRTYAREGSTWLLKRDYVYRDGLLLASIAKDGSEENYTLDHLGSPRVVTDASANRTAIPVYWPYGQPWSTDTQQGKLRFTGHERDAAIAGNSLDYMHARFYTGRVGRFLSVDPVVDVKAARGNPRGWNRYAYVLSNPVRYADPDGRIVRAVGTDDEKKRLLQGVQDNLRPEERAWVTLNKKGEIQIKKGARGFSVAFNDLQKLVRDKNTVTELHSSTIAVVKSGPGPAKPMPPIDLQAAGGGLTVDQSRSMSGNIEVYVDPRGNSKGESPQTILGHELFGHALDVLFNGVSDERSAISKENLLRFDQGLILRELPPR